MRCIAAPYSREKRLKGRTKGQTVFENAPAGGLRPAGFMAAAQGGKLAFRMRQRRPEPENGIRKTVPGRT